MVDLNNIANLLIPSQNTEIIKSVNYSLQSNYNKGEYFGTNGCARCVCTVLCRSGFNPDLFNQSVSYLLYDSLLGLTSIGGTLIIDNNPTTKGTNLFVEPTNIAEINRRVRPGDVIGWRGGDPTTGTSYRTHQKWSHIGIVYNKTGSSNSLLVAHNEQDTRVVADSGTISIKSRSVVGTELTIGTTQFTGFMNHINPFVYRMPIIEKTWSEDITKSIQNRNSQYDSNNRNKFALWMPSKIKLSKLITYFDYEYDYEDE